MRQAIAAEAFGSQVQDAFTPTSMVNYAKPVIGAKKFDSSTFANYTPPPKF